MELKTWKFNFPLIVFVFANEILKKKSSNKTNHRLFVVNIFTIWLDSCANLLTAKYNNRLVITLNLTS